MSSGSFASFFPAHPKVIQEKHKKAALDRQRSKSKANDATAGNSPFINGVLVSTQDAESVSHSRDQANFSTDLYDKVVANGDGDILNDVGSASSLNSTVSSLFSNGAPASTFTVSGTSNAQTLTPVTNHESSPPEKEFSPRPLKVAVDGPNSGFGHEAGLLNLTRNTSKAITPASTPPRQPVHVRPGPGEVKGFKVLYDPELDHKLSSKEKRKLKVRYRNFGEEDYGPSPPDPRLAIPGYTSGEFMVKLTDAKGWKQKKRLAPYTLTPYPWDATISVGPGPPTSVVVTGFDPFTPDSQIRALFSSFGEIAEFENRTDPNTGIFLGVCSIRYRDSRALRGQPIIATQAAGKAEKEGNGQRIGVRTVRVERDRAGRKAQRYVDGLARRNLRRQAEESPADKTKKLEVISDVDKVVAPPPNAPKGPSGRSSLRPPPDAPKSATWPKSQAVLLVENEPILPKLKRRPYIFLAHCYVPVLGTTIPHLKKRLRMYDWSEIRADSTGYYIVFDESRHGETETARCYNDCHMHLLFTYTMNMECQQHGNLNYERSPTPEAALAIKHEKEEKERLHKEEEIDIEEEKTQRAQNLDPVNAAVDRLRVEIREKVMSDIRQRIAAPALFDYLDPDRHAAKRRKLGVPDPIENRRPASYLPIGEETPSGTPDSRHGFSGLSKRPFTVADLNVGRVRKGYMQSTNNAFLDERRKQPPQRRKDIRSLHQRLHDLHEDDDSEDEHRTSLTRDTEEQESRPMSRMSSMPPGEGMEEAVKKRARLDDKENMLEVDTDEEKSDLALARRLLDPHILKKEPEDMAVRELEQIMHTLPRSSKLHQRARTEFYIRQRSKWDDELFHVQTSDATVNSKIDILTSTIQDSVDSSDLSMDSKQKKKTKAKKKSKKQAFEEREALKAQTSSAKDLLKFVPEDLPTPEAHSIDDAELDVDKYEEEEEELRAEVEWGVSTTEPRRTVEDDPEIVLDVDGWQHIVKDDEDLQFLREALEEVSISNFVDTNLWAFKQKEIKVLNNGGIQGVVKKPPGIQGYYVLNPSGCARTEGIKPISQAEKSLYLPHRIKVARARQEREAKAKSNPALSAAAAAVAKQDKMATISTSRSNRANNRRLVNDINTSKQNLAAVTGDSQQGDAIRFNQLKKRKKLVKFDRSAIHGWGLYAEENIAQNDMIIEYVGEKVRQKVADIRELRYDKQGMGSSYLFRIDEDAVVDATKKGGIARFINHSCAPNCTAKIIKVEGTKRIVIYALMDIRKNDELTYDYKFDREMNNEDRIPCLCGSDVCKGFLN